MDSIFWGTEVLWHIFDEPGIPDMLRFGGNLEKMFQYFRMRPVRVLKLEQQEPQPKIYEAKYEVLSHNTRIEDSRFPKVYQNIPGNPIGFIDFLAGIPYDEAELMAVVYEESSREDSAWAQDVTPGSVTPPVPPIFFQGPPVSDIIHNYTAITPENVEHLASPLPDTNRSRLLWWTRVGIYPSDAKGNPVKRPVPGEFLVMAVRLMPGKYWGKQDTNPFLFSGNWLDTLYYTSGTVEEVLEPNDKRPYPLYKVRWRLGPKDANSDLSAEKRQEKQLFLARPSGFERYEVGDRVAILKDAGTERKSQTWKDDQEFQPNIWRIVPITFYDREKAEKGSLP